MLFLELRFALLLFTLLLGLVLRHALFVLGFSRWAASSSVSAAGAGAIVGTGGRLLRLRVAGHVLGNACPCKPSACGQAACHKRRWLVWWLRTITPARHRGYQPRLRFLECGRAERLPVVVPWDCASRFRSGRGRDGLQSPGQGMPQPCCGSSLNRGTGRLERRRRETCCVHCGGGR